MKLGVRLTLYLVGAVFCTMVVFGYLSIQQDKRNLLKDLRLGMTGFAEAVQQTLADIYGNDENVKVTQSFINGLAPEGNIHGVIVFNSSKEPVAISPSIENRIEDFSQIDPDDALVAGKETEGLIRRPGQLIYYRLEPIRNSSGDVAGAFLLLRQGGDLAAAMEIRRDRIIVTTALLVLLICLLIFYFVQTKISRPITELIARIREVGAGHWEQRLEVPGQDEISTLALEFNSMSARLSDTHCQLLREQEKKIKLERDLRHSEKLASVGQLAAGVAHEIGTPLNIIGGRAEQLLRRQRTTEEITEVLHIIRSQIDRIASIVRQLLEFSRRKEPNFQRMDFSVVLSTVERLFHHKLAQKGIKFSLTLPEPAPVILADSDQLQQVFINLFQNSLQALNQGGNIKIQAELTKGGNSLSDLSEDRKWLRILFEDNGRGIAEKDIHRVFEPFFTTKDVGEGTGLGLSVTYGIIKEHGGDIRVESDHAQFTRFIIHLPLPRESNQSHGGEG